jgi:tetratricopeptide (TPR) repeat protein
VLVVTLAGVGLSAAAIQAVRSLRPSASRAVRAVLAPSVGVLGLGVALAGAAPPVLHPAYALPETYALAALEPAPPRTLALVGHDHLAFPAMYLQRVEGQRPDVALAVVGLCSSRWHLEDLARRHPYLPVPVVRPGGPRPLPGPAPLAERVAAALALAAVEVVPVRLEPPPQLPGIPPQGTGLALPLLDLAGRDHEQTPLLALADAEFDRHPERYDDSASRIYRLVRLERAAELARRGRIRDAARVLCRAMGPLAFRDLAPMVALLPARGRPQAVPGCPSISPGFISEPDEPTVALAALLADAGRPEAALPLLQPLTTPRAAAARAEALAMRRGLEQGLRALSGLARDDRLAAVAWMAERSAARGDGAVVEGLLGALGPDRPELAETLLAIGVSLARTGDAARAEQVFERATRADPGRADGYRNLAMAQLEQGRLEDARRNLERAIAADPGDVPARALLADLDRAFDAPRGPASR